MPANPKPFRLAVMVAYLVLVMAPVLLLAVLALVALYPGWCLLDWLSSTADRLYAWTFPGGEPSAPGEA